MKIRSGFVSNSSSSSFIVAGTTPPVVTVKLPVDKAVATKEELDQYFGYEYGYDEEELQGGGVEDYNAAVKAIEQGLTVYFGSIDNEMAGVISVTDGNGFTVIKDGDY